MTQAAQAQTWLALLVLLAWPLVGLSFYASFSPSRATILNFLVAFMVLPVGAAVKVAEGIPQLDKVSVPALTAIVGCLFFAKRGLRFWKRLGLEELLLLIFVFGPIVTSINNTDAVTSGAVTLPGVGVYDGLSACFSQLLFILPFVLGRNLLGSQSSAEQILKCLAIAGLIYTLPMLFEIRMSPQLHRWIYGYYPFGFATQMRYGGFRPAVFMDNGLVATFFLMSSAVATAALWRMRLKITYFPPALATGYLSAVLVLCKSLGTLLYAVFVIPLVRFASFKLQLRVALFFAFIALSYPLLRTFDLFPTTYLVSGASVLNEDRAESLEFRFEHEKALLDRASQRIVFGWGRFGRSRIFDEWGNDISVSDGLWIITLGQFGLLGFISEFGLLGLAVWRSARVLRYVRVNEEKVFLAGLTLVVAVNIIDLLPNASLTPWTWLMVGAVLGRSEELRTAASPKRTASPVPIGGTGPTGGKTELALARTNDLQGERSTWRQ